MAKGQAKQWRKMLKAGFTLSWVTISVMLLLGRVDAAAVTVLVCIVGWTPVFWYLSTRMPKRSRMSAQRSRDDTELDFYHGVPPASASEPGPDTHISDDRWHSTRTAEEIDAGSAVVEHSSPAIAVFDLNADGSFNFSGTGVASSGLHDL